MQNPQTHPFRDYIEAPSESSFSPFYDATAPLVWTICRRLLGNDDEALDAFQSAYCRLTSMHNTDLNGLGHEDIGRLIKQTVVREADAMRKRRTRRYRREFPVEELSAMSDPSADPRKNAAESELNEKIGLLISTLSDRERVPLLLYFYQNMTQQEIGDALGVPTRTVSGRIAKALRQLKPKLRNAGLTESFSISTGTALLPPPTRATASFIYHHTKLALASSKHASTPISAGAQFKALFLRLIREKSVVAALTLICIAVGSAAVAWHRHAPVQMRRTATSSPPKIPQAASPTSSPVINEAAYTHYDNVQSDFLGNQSNPLASPLQAILDEHGMTSKTESVCEVFKIPPEATSLKFTVLLDNAGFTYHFGIFDLSAVTGIPLGDPEFVITALRQGVPLLDDSQIDPGDSVEISVADLGLAGKSIAFFIIPNDRIANYLASPYKYTPKGEGDDRMRQPLSTLSGANPFGYDQAQIFRNDTETIIAFEDMSRMPPVRGPWPNSNESYDDLVVSITPPLQPASVP